MFRSRFPKQSTSIVLDILSLSGCAGRVRNEKRGEKRREEVSINAAFIPYLEDAWEDQDSERLKVRVPILATISWTGRIP